jgi:Lipopolysaccharide kinase (Kdo/WaaP) family
VRRSRHSTTYHVQSPSADLKADLFVKYFDPPARSERLKAYLRGARAERVERITAFLTSAGFNAPKVLLRGRAREGCELLVTARAEGDGPLISLNRLAGSLKAKRALLRALGHEVARLHGAGFVHGDLTPFNIRIVGGEPPRFAFLDNERTRHRLVIRRRRGRLRNLVQLGRFALPGLTRTDRLRFFLAYEAALHHRHSRSRLRRATAMLTRRMRKGGVGESVQK